MGSGGRNHIGFGTMPQIYQITDTSPLLHDVNCVYCHVDLELGEQVAVCDECSAPHHSDCWQANQNYCATFGCNGNGWANLPEGIQATNVVQSMLDKPQAFKNQDEIFSSKNSGSSLSNYHLEKWLVGLEFVQGLAAFLSTIIGVLQNGSRGKNNPIFFIIFFFIIFTLSLTTIFVASRLSDKWGMLLGISGIGMIILGILIINIVPLGPYNSVVPMAWLTAFYSILFAPLFYQHFRQLKNVG